MPGPFALPVTPEPCRGGVPEPCRGVRHGPIGGGTGPFHMVKPGAIWHLDVDGCCRIHPDMEIVRKRGCLPRFPFEPFLERQKAYDSGAEKHVWESLKDMEHAVAREGGTTMLGHIAAETAKKWLGWELGELYGMGYREKVVFCIYGGLDCVHKANCRKGGQVVLLFLRRPLRAQVAEQGGHMPFAAPLYCQSPRSPPRGSACPLLALHPRRLELGREGREACRGRSSRRSASRDIRRMAGRAPSWCSWDLGLGPSGGEIALVRAARLPAVLGAPALFQLELGGRPGVGGLGRQQPGLGSKRFCSRPLTGMLWLGLSRSPAARAFCCREEARRLSSRICPPSTRRHRRTLRAPF